MVNFIKNEFSVKLILKLVAKDFRICKKILLQSILSSLLISSLMVTIIDNESWIPFISLGCAAISFGILYCLSFEKIRKIEILVCSLPVKRDSILLAKYFTAAFIITIGISLWFGIGYLLYAIISSAPDNFFWFTNPLTWFMIVFYFSLLISIIIPVLAGCDSVAAITIMVLAIAFI